MTARIEVRGAGKAYTADGARFDALADVDLDVGAGEFVAVMGPSGSGKSTLLYLLGGLDRPTSGHVHLDGVDLATLSAQALAHLRGRRIGFVFQMFNLMAGLTAEENIALPAIIAGQRPASYRRRVAELLDAVGLVGLSGRYPSQLSGGQQQRVAIARALIMTPSVLLADEPTGNLDSRSGIDIMKLLSARRAEGQAVVLVTHDAKVASYADRIVFIRDGRLVQQTALTGEASPPMADLVQTGEG